jgi:hypothetical protein
MITKESKILIVGCGEIGGSWFNLFLEQGFINIQRLDPEKGLIPNWNKFDIVMICFPFTDKFVNEIAEIESKFEFTYMLIESSISPFILNNLRLNYDKHTYIHSPCRGTHPDLVKHLHQFVKFVAPVNSLQELETRIFASHFYPLLNIRYDLFHCSDETAMAKIVNTTWYAMEIAFSIQMKQFCDIYGLDFNEVYVKSMATDKIGRIYNLTEGGRYMCKEEDRIDRPVMRPGIIGGHCCMPNIELLKDVSNFTDFKFFYQWVKAMNDYMVKIDGDDNK